MTPPVDRSGHVGRRCNLGVHPLIATLTYRYFNINHFFLTVTIKLDNKMEQPRRDKHYETLQQKHGAWQQLSTRFTVKLTRM